jgi:hypothetical protein
MKLESASTAGSRLLLILGWVISAIPILMMGAGGTVMLISSPGTVAKQLTDYGYPTHLATTILALEIGCAVIYAIPPTAVLGAILMTGYLGGAVATHVHAGETPHWVAPIVMGVLAWLGLFLRDKRLRALAPFRR